MAFPMKRLAWFALAISSPAAAAPTYLKCVLDGNWPVEVAVDEANSKVTVFIPVTGHTQRLNAAFSQDQVRFGDRLVSYVVSRTDLSIVRTVPLLKETTGGRCYVATVPDRAF